MRYISAVQRPMPRTCVSAGDQLLVAAPRGARERRPCRRAPSPTGRAATRACCPRGRPPAAPRPRRRRSASRRERARRPRAHPPVDRLRRAAGQLLEDDGADERAERPVGIARPVREGPARATRSASTGSRAATSSMAAAQARRGHAATPPAARAAASTAARPRPTSARGRRPPGASASSLANWRSRSRTRRSISRHRRVERDLQRLLHARHGVDAEAAGPGVLDHLARQHQVAHVLAGRTTPCEPSSPRARQRAWKPRSLCVTPPTGWTSPCWLMEPGDGEALVDGQPRDLGEQRDDLRDGRRVAVDAGVGLLEGQARGQRQRAEVGVAAAQVAADDQHALVVDRRPRAAPRAPR